MLSLALSTFAYIVAAWFIKRRLDDADIPKGFTRNVLIFSLALAVSYGVGALVSWIDPR
ncbi:MAG: hypothetical protein ACRET1_06150 [Burkholderiales bacterium]